MRAQTILKFGAAAGLRPGAPDMLSQNRDVDAGALPRLMNGRRETAVRTRLAIRALLRQPMSDISTPLANQGGDCRLMMRTAYGAMAESMLGHAG